MYKFVVDIVALVFMCVYEHADGSIQLMDGRKIHRDSLRSDRVFIFSSLIMEHHAKRLCNGVMWNICSHPSLADMIDDIPLQELPRP